MIYLDIGIYRDEYYKCKIDTILLDLKRPISRSRSIDNSTWLIIMHTLYIIIILDRSRDLDSTGTKSCELRPRRPLARDLFERAAPPGGGGRVIIWPLKTALSLHYYIYILPGHSGGPMHVVISLLWIDL